MITVKYSNDLAVDMFLIAAAYSATVDSDDKLILPKWRYFQYFETDLFFREESSFCAKDKFLRGPNDEFSKIPNSESLLLEGVFNSPKYFMRNFKNELFKPEATIIKYIKDKYGDFLDQKNTVSIFVTEDVFPDKADSLDYYRKALTFFPINSNFLIISPNILWAKDHFVGERFVFADSERAIVQLFLSYCCDHNIISNNYVSWWGAYLNQNSRKRIVCPSDWYFGGTVLKDPGYLSSWTQVSNKQEIKKNYDSVFYCPKPEIRRLFEDHLTFSDSKVQFEIDQPAEELHEPDMTRVFVQYSLDGVLPEDKGDYDLILGRDCEPSSNATPFHVGGSLISDYNRVVQPLSFDQTPSKRELGLIYNGKKDSEGDRVLFDIYRHKNSINFPRNFVFDQENSLATRKGLLKQSMYCIVAENERCDGYFSDLLVDCFLYNVIPVYWGCPDVYKYFNHNGIVTFLNFEDLKRKLQDLNKEFYTSKKAIIRSNRKRALYYAGTFHRIKNSVEKI